MGGSSLVGMFASPRPGCRKTHGKLMIPASTTYLAAIASLRLSERIGSSDRWRKLAETSGAARLHGLRLRVLKVTLSRRIYAVTRRAMHAMLALHSSQSAKTSAVPFPTIEDRVVCGHVRQVVHIRADQRQYGRKQPLPERPDVSWQKNTPDD